MAIDYSEIKQPETHTAQEEWEPPTHKFFGKKLPNGKMEKEPTYYHQEYPRMMYAQNGEDIKARVVNSDEELKELGSGWAKTPAEFGYLGAPSFDQHLALKNKEADVAEAPKRGRPAKVD